jgi:hypothetical protein
MVKSNHELFELIDKNKKENCEQEHEKKKREEFLEDFRRKREEKRKEKLGALKDQQKDRDDLAKRENDRREREVRQRKAEK